MNVTYSKDVDILMVELSPRAPIAFAEKRGDVVVHFDRQRQPVALEFLDATDLLRRAYRVLPKDVGRAVITA